MGSTAEPVGVDPAALDIVIVNYHSGNVLGRCVDALRAFLPAATNYVFVDNSPDDGAVAAVRGRVGHATVLPQATNVGYAAAVNAAVAATSAPTVLLVNPDVIRINGDLERVRLIFDDPSVAVVTGRIVNDRGDVTRCRHRPAFRDLLELAVSFNRFLPRALRWRSSVILDWDHDSPRDVENFMGAFLLIRRAALADVGPFDERFFFYWEETDWLMRAFQRGWRAVFTPELEVVHLGRASSPASAGHSELFVESTHRFARKHFGLIGGIALSGAWTAMDTARLVRQLAFGEPAKRDVVLRRLRVHVKELRSGRRTVKPRAGGRKGPRPAEASR
jgi:GT2 family glycosyltransferase